MDRLEKKNRFDGSLRFTAKDFFKLSGREKQAGLREEEKIFGHFGDPETYLIKEEYLTYRSCVCGDNCASLLFVKHGFRFIVCGRCGFLYVNPILKNETYLEFYKNEESWFEVLQNPVQVELDNLKFSYGLEIIERYLKRRGKLLDIGCGNCGFLDAARKKGWNNSSGTEYNLKALEIAKAKGHVVINAGINDPYFSGKTFDVITLWEVLEHVPDPRAEIHDVSALLNPGGSVFFLVPNRDSLINRMLREKSGSFTGHCHINFFNAKILGALLKEAGFSVLHVETVISELGNVRNYLDYGDAYAGAAEDDLAFLTPALIHDNLLGCKLLVLARKNT